MDLQKEKTEFRFIKPLLALLISAAVFLIAGGVVMLFQGKETTGAVVCIIVGVVALFFFGIGSFLISHPGNHFGGALLAGFGVLIGGGLTIAVLGGAFYGLFINPIIDIEHYRQVRQTPVTVTAVVTDHDSYDDDGDTDYRSYVTYVYDNVRYRDFPYENVDKEDDLTPLGREVTIQISPKDPRKQISELKRSSKTIPFVIEFAFLALAALCVLLQRLSLTQYSHGTPDTETIQKDIKVKIRSRLLRPFLLFCWVGYGLLYWRYSMILGILPLIVAVLCGICWAYCMYTTIRDYRRAESGDYTTQWDILVDKQEYTDSDNDTRYSLHYKSGERTWHTSVSATAYYRANIGDSVLAVYLPDKKKPIVHYDKNGKAN